MEQNSIILVNKYSLSRLSTGFSVFSFFLMLKKVTSRETKFWLMYSIEYSTRNQQQNTEWWHIEWTSRVVNYNETIEREKENHHTIQLFSFSPFLYSIFPLFFVAVFFCWVWSSSCCCWLLVLSPRFPSIHLDNFVLIDIIEYMGGVDQNSNGTGRGDREKYVQL